MEHGCQKRLPEDAPVEMRWDGRLMVPCSGL